MIPSIREILLILLVGLIVILWQRRARWLPDVLKQGGEPRPRQGRSRPRSPPKAESQEEAATLQECPVCKVYQLPGPQAACDRHDCPFLIKGHRMR